MFAKVFSQILDSSIAEDFTVRHVFMDLLVLADSEGSVDMTIPAIARRTNVPIKIVKSAIEKLSEPDGESRSKTEDGRRIIPIDSHRDWGWIIVNYGHYRAITDNEFRRSYFRDQKRLQREKAKCPQVVLDKNEMSTASTHAEGEAEVEGEAEEPPKPPVKSEPSGGDGKDVYPTTEFAQRISKLFNKRLTTAWSEKEIKAFKALTRRDAITHDALDLIEAYYHTQRERGDEGRHRRDLQTFLNNFDGELDRATNAAPVKSKPEEEIWVATEPYNMMEALRASKAQEDAEKAALGEPQWI